MSARGYSMRGTITPTVADDSLAFLENAAQGDAFIQLFEAVLGAPTSSADGSAEFALYHGAGGTPTGGAGTELALNRNYPAAGATGLSDLTAEPTTKNDLIHIPLNQRGTFRWIAQPGMELVITDTAGDGIGCDCTSFQGTAYDEVVTMLWRE